MRVHFIMLIFMMATVFGVSAQTVKKEKTMPVKTVKINSNVKAVNINTKTTKFAPTKVGTTPQQQKQVISNSRTTRVASTVASQKESVKTTDKPAEGAHATANTKKINSNNDKTVLPMAETMPDFPTGMNGMMQFVQDNMIYPNEAKSAGKEGRVLLRFTVWSDGSISEIEVIRSEHQALTQEAIRLIESMPLWKPAMQGNKKVACKYSVPIIFRL